jgi:ABC-2 type transport system permease protein
MSSQVSTVSTRSDERATSSPVTLTDVLRSEWTKLHSLRSTAYTLMVTVLFGVGVSALISYADGRAYHQAAPIEQSAFDPTAISLNGYIHAQLGIAVLGVLMLSSEFATGTIHTSLVAVPRRGRMLAAKAAVCSAVVLVAGQAVGFPMFFVGQAVLKWQEAPHVTLGQPHVLRAVLGTGLYLAVVGVLGVAVGTLVRVTAGGLAVMATVTLLIPALAGLLSASWAKAALKFWPTAAGARLMTVVPDPDALGPWAGFALLCAFVAVTMTAAYAMFRSRDA